MKSEWQVRIFIHTNPTTTDFIIPYDTSHSIDQRLAAIRFLSTRLCTYALLPQDKEIKIQIISTVVFNNHFNLYILDQVSHKDNKHSKTKENNMNKNETSTSKRYISLMSLKKL